MSLSFCFPGQNAIVIVSGANFKLTESDVQRSEGLISSARVVVCQLEIKPDVTVTALKLAKKHNGNFYILVVISAKVRFSCFILNQHQYHQNNV